MAKGVQLYGVRVLNCVGKDPSSPYASWVIGGVDWVTANRILPAVANMSLGGRAYDPLDTAVRNSIASGVVYTIAAGNSSNDASNYSPARVAEAITIGATTPTDMRASSYSNYGSVLDLFAPGDGINSTWPAGLPTPPGISCYLTSNDTANCSGTSQAAPHVAGVAAMYLQLNPGASPSSVRDAIVSEATANIVGDPGPGSPNLLLYSGFMTTPPPPPPPPPGPGRWKLDGEGNCYWDQYDSGPNQCTQGRWKLDGNGNCYWDANDSGPDQCVPSAPADEETRWTRLADEGKQPPVAVRSEDRPIADLNRWRLVLLT